ncbi:MAG: CvpA family protein [Planctomycetota bacterium]|nr:CvpA family protein [Planctomycetota bacterium]
MSPLLASLSTPDTIVLVMCVVLAIRGAFKGFTWQLVRTVGLIGAIWVAGWLHEPVGAWLDERLDVLPSDWNPVAAWLLLVVGAWLIVTFVAYMARGVVRTADLTSTDRVLGFAMGAVMGLAFATIAFIVYGRVADDEQLTKTLEHSVSARFMAQLIDVVEPIIPGDVCERWGETLDAIKQAGELLPADE